LDYTCPPWLPSLGASGSIKNRSLESAKRIEICSYYSSPYWFNPSTTRTKPYVFPSRRSENSWRCAKSKRGNQEPPKNIIMTNKRRRAWGNYANVCPFVLALQSSLAPCAYFSVGNTHCTPPSLFEPPSRYRFRFASPPLHEVCGPTYGINPPAPAFVVATCMGTSVLPLWYPLRFPRELVSLPRGCLPNPHWGISYGGGGRNTRPYPSESPVILFNRSRALLLMSCHPRPPPDVSPPPQHLYQDYFPGWTAPFSPFKWRKWKQILVLS